MAIPDPHLQIWRHELFKAERQRSPRRALHGTFTKTSPISSPLLNSKNTLEMMVRAGYAIVARDLDSRMNPVIGGKHDGEDDLAFQHRCEAWLARHRQFVQRRANYNEAIAKLQFLARQLP